MSDTIWPFFLGGGLTFLVTGLFYEVLCCTSYCISKVNAGPRGYMYIMTVGVFVAHALSILVYALTYWILISYFNFTPFAGETDNRFIDIMYFSMTTYTSLGVGDIQPLQELRMLTGIETLNGLVLITWSATFTYFSVQKMWEEHGIEPKFCCSVCNKETEK